MSDYCETCSRPKSRCLCSYVRPVLNSTPVFILQHRKERLHPKGTAKLAQLCLRKCTLISDKNFDTTLDKIVQDYRPILLWPSNQHAELTLLSDDLKHKNDRPIALVVIDATWKKASKIYLSHKQLHEFPKLNIEGHDNQYHNRKSPSERHLSSLEAIYYGLTVIEGGASSDTGLASEEKKNQNSLDDLLTAQKDMIEDWYQKQPS